MKSIRSKLTAVCLTALLAASFACVQERKSKTYGSNLHVQAPKQNKKQLSEKTYNWIQESLDRRQFISHNIDTEGGVFQGRGSFADSAGIVQYELSIFTRNNNVQLVFDVNFHKQNPVTRAKLNDNYLRHKTQQHFQDLARSLEAYLNETEP